MLPWIAAYLISLLIRERIEQKSLYINMASPGYHVVHILLGMSSASCHISHHFFSHHLCLFLEKIDLFFFLYIVHMKITGKWIGQNVVETIQRMGLIVWKTFGILIFCYVSVTKLKITKMNTSKGFCLENNFYV